MMEDNNIATNCALGLHSSSKHEYYLDTNGITALSGRQTSAIGHNLTDTSLAITPNTRLKQEANHRRHNNITNQES